MRVIEMLRAAVRRLRDRAAVRRLEKIVQAERRRQAAVERVLERGGKVYDAVLGRWVGRGD